MCVLQGLTVYTILNVVGVIDGLQEVGFDTEALREGCIDAVTLRKEALAHKPCEKMALVLRTRGKISLTLCPSTGSAH